MIFMHNIFYINLSSLSILYDSVNSIISSTFLLALFLNFQSSQTAQIEQTVITLLPLELRPLVIAFKVFGWFEFTVLKGFMKGMYRGKLLSENENFLSMIHHYNARVEIAELQTSSFENLIESTPDFSLMQSTHRKHIVCFVDPNEFRLLISKMSNLQFHSLLIIISLEDEASTDEAFTHWSNVFSTFTLNIDSEIYFSIQFHNSPQTLPVYEWYKICEECSPIQRHICNFDVNSTQANTDCLIDKYQRRQDLNGSFLSVIGVDVQPFYASISVNERNQSQIHGGMFAEVFKALTNDLNLTYTLQILNGYKYGAFVNGSWNGMIGSLSRNEADLTVSELSLAPDRIKYIDYSLSFDSIGRKIYVRKTREEKKINWRFYVSPFKPILYTAIAICAFTLILLLWSFVRIDSLKGNKFDLAEAAWLILSCFCQQGSHFIPNGPSVKIVFIVAYFTSLILFSCYSATLISQLSVSPLPTLPFNGLAGLVTKTNDWLGGPIKGDLSHIYMEKTCPEIISSNPKDNSNIQCQLLTAMWVKIVRKDATVLPISFEDGLKKVLKGKFAFVATSSGTRYRINNQLGEEDSCRINEMDGDYVSSNLAFGLRKNNSLKNIINYKLLKLWQSGSIQRLKNIWLPQRKVCLPKTSGGYADATVYDVAMAPLLVGLGIIFSCVLLVIERTLRSQLSQQPQLTFVYVLMAVLF